MFTFTSCQNYLDVNKNEDAPDKISPELYLAGILDVWQGIYDDNRFANSMSHVQGNGNNWSSHYYSASSDTGGEMWRVNYWLQGVNLENMINQSLEKEAYTLAGIGYIIKAYSWDWCTKYYGEMPLKQAYQSGILSFDYDYQEPAEGELFGVSAQIVPCPWNAQNRLLMLGLKASDAAAPTGNNLVFLVDVSGSMNSDDKLPLLQKTFSYLVSNLGENDRVSIVTYSGKEEVVLKGCPGDSTDRILSAIRSLSAYGSTNGEAGLTMAYQVAEKHFKADNHAFKMIKGSG